MAARELRTTARGAATEEQLRQKEEKKKMIDKKEKSGKQKKRSETLSWSEMLQAASFWGSNRLLLIVFALLLFRHRIRAANIHEPHGMLQGGELRKFCGDVCCD